MLLHAFTDRVDAGSLLHSITSPLRPRRFDDVALLTAASMCFALGAATVEQVKHLSGRHVAPLAGLQALPDLRTLRPRLAAVADGCDPLRLQSRFAAAMLDTDPAALGVYYVDDHFVPYTGAKPVPKGWNTKRRHAQPGRADTHVVDWHGRAVCFTTGEPSGLTKTLPTALTELTTVIGAAKVMIGFDRGGSYDSVFTACRDAGLDWITYRRAPLAAPGHLPVVTTVTRGARTTTIAWCDEIVTLSPDYGVCRQITVFTAGAPVVQVLTNDQDTCPAALLWILVSRWRQENFFKYASHHYGIDALCDYHADLRPDVTRRANPARKPAKAALKTAQDELAAAERALTQLLGDRTRPVAQINDAVPAARTRIEQATTALDQAKATLKTIPAKLPANQIDPDATQALLRTRRRTLQMVLRLLACNAEQWLATHLSAYLPHDDQEHRAITRQTIIRGLGGTITYTREKITVALDQPDTPRIARALRLFLDEINHTPPRMPGDPRPITYTLTP
jgi:hypothetical protein